MGSQSICTAPPPEDRCLRTLVAGPDAQLPGVAHRGSRAGEARVPLPRSRAPASSHRLKLGVDCALWSSLPVARKVEYSVVASPHATVTASAHHRHSQQEDMSTIPGRQGSGPSRVRSTTVLAGPSAQAAPGQRTNGRAELMCDASIQRPASPSSHGGSDA